MIFIYPLINQAYIDNSLYGPLGENGISESIMTDQEQKTAEFYQRYKVILKNLNGWFGSKHALKNINLNITEKTIVSFIGPSGCGKTTLIRCLNRMHEMTLGARVTGEVFIDGVNIYDKSIDPIIVRRRIGMVFQKPNPFPTMTIFNNVAAGLKLNGIRDRKLISEVVEESLREAALWDEVKNELNKPGMSLSGGQRATTMHCQGPCNAARSITDGRTNVVFRPDSIFEN